MKTAAGELWENLDWHAANQREERAINEKALKNRPDALKAHLSTRAEDYQSWVKEACRNAVESGAVSREIVNVVDTFNFGETYLDRQAAHTACEEGIASAALKPSEPMGKEPAFEIRHQLFMNNPWP
jgi:hypothetical protein